MIAFDEARAIVTGVPALGIEQVLAEYVAEQIFAQIEDRLRSCQLASEPVGE